MSLPGKKNWPVDSTFLSPTPANLVVGLDLLRSWCYKGFHTGTISDSAPMVSGAIRARGTAPSQAPPFCAWRVPRGLSVAPDPLISPLGLASVSQSPILSKGIIVSGYLSFKDQKVLCSLSFCLNWERTKTFSHLGPCWKGRKGESPRVTQKQNWEGVPRPSHTRSLPRPLGLTAAFAFSGLSQRHF